MSVHAIGCRVLLKVHNIGDLDPVMKRAKASGIALPTADEDFRRREAGVDQGTVVEIGPSADKAYVGGLKIGDMVAFAKYAGKIIADPDDPEQKYLAVNDEDVVAVMRSKHG